MVMVRMPTSRPVIIVGLGVERPADADLHRADGIEQFLFDGAAEGRAVSVFRLAEVAVVGIGVRVEMHHADGPVLGDGAHDRQGDEMIAPGRQRHGARGMHPGEEVFDPLQGVHQVDGVDAGVAQVRDIAKLIGRFQGLIVDPPHEGGLIADLPRAVAGARPVGGAAVPGHADQADIDPGRIFAVRQAHEGRNPAVARHDKTAERLIELLGHRNSPSVKT